MKEREGGTYERDSERKGGGQIILTLSLSFIYYQCRGKETKTREMV